MIFQGMQSETYFEVVNGELVVSRMQGVPVVRYGTGDRADILPFYEMIARFSVNGLNRCATLKKKGMPRRFGRRSFCYTEGWTELFSFMCQDHSGPDQGSS